MDEAGDLTLFNKHGKIVVGAEGSSHCFLVGLCEIREPAVLGKALEVLHARATESGTAKGIHSGGWSALADPLPVQAGAPETLASLKKGERSGRTP